MPINLWGPWHSAEDKSEGTLMTYNDYLSSMISPEIIMDICPIFQCLQQINNIASIKSFAVINNLKGQMPLLIV